MKAQKVGKVERNLPGRVKQSQHEAREKKQRNGQGDTDKTKLPVEN